MKRAAKTKGCGWDVCTTTGSAQGDLQIQRCDYPEGPRGEELRPAFKDDEEAIRHVVRLAKRGDAEAVEALWEVLPHDALVNQVMWLVCS